MPSHTKAELAKIAKKKAAAKKKAGQKVASNGTKPKAKNGLGGMRLKDTRAKRKRKEAKKAMT